ncbi:unnamed protein product [Blepharisma stoltei]|uniref:C2H2-type domain-containing protein n=1 Tax=Blepharisma stoltei TaxID=1481888 RepID=A0AAU9IMV6_9CILI|nr:unnamed protein product [Blepharisma stoltei]
MIEEAWYQVGEEELLTPSCTNNLFEIQILPKSNGKRKQDNVKPPQSYETENCNDSSTGKPLSLVCPSSSCFYVLNSIEELSTHVATFHKFSCNIPNCSFTTTCLCKLSDHIKKSHHNYKKLPVVPASSISKMCHESKHKNPELPAKRSINLESHATEILNGYFSNQINVTDINDPLSLKKRK